MIERKWLLVEQLVPAPWNPKKRIGGPARDGLRESLDHFGWLDDLKVWPDPDDPGRYFVLDGNQRLDLIRESEETGPIECRVLQHLDPEDARLYTAAKDRNQALYDETKLAGLAASLETQSIELRSRLLRLSPAVIARADQLTAATPMADREADQAAGKGAIPLMLLLTEEGHAELKDGILAIKQRLARENRLRAAVAALRDRELDDVAVELALRIAHARTAAPKTGQR